MEMISVQPPLCSCAYFKAPLGTITQILFSVFYLKHKYLKSF